MSALGEVWSSRELLRNLTMREVKGKYKRTALGQLWSFANPIAMMLIYSFVFRFVIRVQPDPGDPSGLDVFALWLMAGLLPWSFFTNVVNGGMNVLVGNENLIKKVYFPRSTLIISTGLSWLYSWSIEMSVLVVAIIAFGGEPLIWIPLTALAMGLLVLFATGVAMVLSIVNVYFRDVQHLMMLVFQVWFYANPIVYPVHMVQEGSDALGPLFGTVSLMDLYLLNPFYYFIDVFRSLLYDNRMPDGDSFLIVIVLSLTAAVFGWFFFQRHGDRLAEVL